MEMIKVESSNIQEIGYDKENKTLYTQFNSGLYMYHDVPETLFESLKSALSKGQFLNSFIKNNFTFSKLVKK